MKDGPNIAKIAALLGDSARADALTALMADRALTATELAAIAGVTKQTMSAHLSKKLLDASLDRRRSAGAPSIFQAGGRGCRRFTRIVDGRRISYRCRAAALESARACVEKGAGLLRPSGRGTRGTGIRISGAKRLAANVAEGIAAERVRSRVVPQCRCESRRRGLPTPNLLSAVHGLERAPISPGRFARCRFVITSV